MKNEIERYLAKLRGAKRSYPFGPEALVFKVMGKMFALVSQGEDVSRVTLKCAPEDAVSLTGQFQSVSPGYYMNKKHWVTISLTGEISQDMLFSLADDSYALVVSKLTRKDREALKTLLG